MSLAQPAFELASHHPAKAPFGAVVARQLSVWPFAARIARLFLLLDPSLPDQALRSGLLRAMQQAYFASDGYSQTRAVREAALAAHYVLRHRNRDVLPLDQINAATAVAALRGDIAFVALAGQAAAFAWREDQLTGQRGILRLPRPLGLEQDPLITLWSTPMRPGDRLVLVCGASWQADSAHCIGEILTTATSIEIAEQQLSAVLGGAQPAGVLVVGPRSEPKPVRHLRLVRPTEPADPAPAAPAPRAAMRPPRRLRHWLSSAFGVVLLGAVALGALTIVPQPSRPAPEAPSQTAAMAERVDRISAEMAVRLGPAAGNVVDLAVGDDALFTLDVVEGSVRGFPLDALDQQPTPETLLLQAGTTFDVAGHRLAQPVAIAYLIGQSADQGVLAVVDQARALVQIDHDRRLSPRSVPSSASWQEVGALGSDSNGRLFFLDSGARRLLEYPPLSQRVVDPPQVLVEPARLPQLPFDRVAEIIGEGDSVVLGLDDGTVHRLDGAGADLRIDVHSVANSPVTVTALASDRAGGLYLADPANARVLQTNLDGMVLRELRDPTLAGVRQIQTSLDGRRLYGLVGSGVLVFDLPAL
jgi:hypothetical protein